MSGAAVTQRERKATPFQRWFANGYDWFFDRIDARGGDHRRRRLAEGATGQVLEIGAGTGRNLPLYHNASLVVALEPDPGMRERAEEAARRAPRPVELVDGRAEDLPFPEGSFDTVVASYVFCTVSDPDQALREVHRVLRRDGTLRFYEHVRAADPRLAWWQDRLARPWAWLGRGDHPNRDTVTAIGRAGLRVVDLEAFDFQAMPRLVRPHVLGVADRARPIHEKRRASTS
jgi:ubiquinone/menaquinone biosynthesis C-methylase UbiE